MSISPAFYTLKQEIEASLENLPLDALKEVVDFLDYLRVKYKKSYLSVTPYRPGPLGGVWKDQIIEEKDSKNVHQEVWMDFGDRQF